MLRMALVLMPEYAQKLTLMLPFFFTEATDDSLHSMLSLDGDHAFSAYKNSSGGLLALALLYQLEA